MKNLKIILLIFCMAVSLEASALKSNEATQSEYLIKHGHSEEILRMVDLQKSRVEPNKPENKEVKNDSRFVKFFKNLFYERDITLPTEDFGQDKVRTVESPER